MSPHPLPLAVALLALAPLARAAEAEPRVAASVDVAPVWSAHPVGFCLLTQPPHQFAAFYDADRRMTVASRRLDDTRWTLTRLPETLGWDSHNSVTLALDSAGHLHLSGNMHVRPLVYFRSARPFDAASLRRHKNMVGDREERCTYPHFLKGPRGELIFTYRDGRSGSGDQVFNVYDPGKAEWARLLDRPLTAAGGQANAYFHGPVRGPDGTFHLCWVWRDTPDCSTNHDLCYAQSPDLRAWRRSDGTPLKLPITPATAEVVDPVPAKGGLINGNTRIGFDRQGRVVLSYHKYDDRGRTQLYSARREGQRWVVRPTSDWDYRWEFAGGGSIPFEIGFGPVTPQPDGTLTQSYSHVRHGSGAWRLDETTLRPTGPFVRPPSHPRALGRPESSFPGLAVRWAEDQGTSGEPGVRYVLRWETLGPNRDRPRPPPLPEPSTLRLIQLSSPPAR